MAVITVSQVEIESGLKNRGYFVTEAHVPPVPVIHDEILPVPPVPVIHDEILPVPVIHDTQVELPEISGYAKYLRFLPLLVLFAPEADIIEF